MIPNYRNIKHTHNKPQTPTRDWVCDFCQKPLTDKNRADISTKIISLEQAIYQLCKDCRRRFYGRIDDALMLKYAYKIAEERRRKEHEPN